MNITIFGARGTVGSRIVDEAAARGHRVTAVSRHSDDTHSPDHPDRTPQVRSRRGDATHLDDIIDILHGQDALIAATRPRSGQEAELIASTQTLLKAAATTGTRLLISGGAATLRVPDSGVPVLEDVRYLTPATRPIALACAEQLAVCQLEPSADWTYFSPTASIFSGERTGRFRIGEDELIVDSRGESRLSLEDLAVAVLDEIEHPRFSRRRYTAAY